MQLASIRITPTEIQAPTHFFEAATIMVIDYLRDQLDTDRYEVVIEDLESEVVENQIRNHRRIIAVKYRYNDHNKERPFDGRYVTLFIKSGQQNRRGEKLSRLATIYADFNLHTGRIYRSWAYESTGIVTLMKAVSKFILD